MFLDETGFSPSLPPTYTWARPGIRPVVPYENPRSRRVNTMVLLATPGAQVGTTPAWWTAPFTSRAEHFVDILRHALPGDRARPRVGILDNASIHRSKVVKAAAPGQNIHLYYLPAPTRS